MVNSLAHQFRNLAIEASHNRAPPPNRAARPSRRYKPQMRSHNTLSVSHHTRDYAALCRAQQKRVEETLRIGGILKPEQRLCSFLAKNRLAGRDETVFNVFDRACTFLAESGVTFYGEAEKDKMRERFLQHVCNFELILGSPILTNAGRRETKSISSCSIPPVKLGTMSRQEIAKMVGEYHTRGMGTGFCLDELSDPIDMVKYLNHIAVSEVQNGLIERSVGNMGVLSIDHPSVLAFIRIKKDNPHIKEWKFNLSVNVTDEFLSCLSEKRAFTLKNGKQVDPAALMHEMAASAHSTGDPGLIFMDRINQLNRVPQAGRYKTVVTCGETSLFEGEVCQFSYLNLPRFLNNQTIDKDALRKAIHTTVLLLDNAVEANSQRMPNAQSAEIISSLRRIGIGVCGFAEVLQAMGLAYGSAEARVAAQDLMSFINFESKWASVLLAKERGPFKLFDHPQTRSDLFLGPFANRPTNFVTEQDWQRLTALFQAHKIRHVATTILPPSGRSSIMAGVSPSIEPPFRLITDAAFKRALQKHSLLHGYQGNLERIYEEVTSGKSLQESDLPTSVKEIFKTALELTPLEHLQMTAAFQQHTDEGISKTINVPAKATVADVDKIFQSAYSSGLKGVTIYRDSSRTLQPKALSKTSTGSMKAHTVSDHIYGTIAISERVRTLLDSKLLTRLKGVHQTGTNYLVDPQQSTTRYEHCVGAMALTQLLGGDESKQIAALLHDISHTAFSHVIDLVFDKSEQNYHDLMREKFLRSDDAKQAIAECGITKSELACEAIAMVKGKGLNVDRLDYAIRDLHAVNRIYHPEYSSILNNLVVDEDGEIKCKNLETARLIFNKFIEANREIYFHPLHEAASVAMAAILQSLLRQGRLTEEDFFSTDAALIAKILESPLRSVFEKIGPKMEYAITVNKTEHIPYLRKLRYVNPKIIGMPGQLTEYCPASKKHLETYLSTTPTTIYYHIPILREVP